MTWLRIILAAVIAALKAFWGSESAEDKRKKELRKQLSQAEVDYDYAEQQRKEAIINSSTGSPAFYKYNFDCIRLSGTIGSLCSRLGISPTRPRP